MYHARCDNVTTFSTPNFPLSLLAGNRQNESETHERPEHMARESFTGIVGRSSEPEFLARFCTLLGVFI